MTDEISESARAAKTSELVTQLHRLAEALEVLYPGRKFTPDGHLVGSLGEVKAAELLDLTLLPPGNKGCDAFAVDGRMVEIKATYGKRGVGVRRSSKGIADALVVLKLSKDGGAEVVYNGPYAVAHTLIDGKPHTSNGQISMSLARLRKLNATVPHLLRVPSRHSVAAVDPNDVRGLEFLTDRIIGCLVGGAIGDALGAPIEFDSWLTIQSKFGPTGVTGFVEGHGLLGAVTDDTQLTLFTTEGLIRASVRGRTKGICHPPTVVRHAYLRWLWTQGNGKPLTAAFGGADQVPDGWLVGLPALQHRRAPGATCLAALEHGGVGSVREPPNNSKDSGGVVRAAPVGFVSIPAADRFELGCQIAAITHGHPCGYLPAGFLAVVVGELIDGGGLPDALDSARRVLASWEHCAETLEAVDRGRLLGERGVPTPADLAELGEGWSGEEALSIAIACAISAATFEAGVLVAVNHSGDSDSTGSITGNILGSLLDQGGIDWDWRQTVEFLGVMETLACDAALEFHGEPPSNDDAKDFRDWWKQYPGW
ncbi:MAG: ADP-ribosyl-[dinitrogen reductase] hydrolase [Ilumatobacter sp.]|jgi:ADP-ribosyl-[dinitrogen reductase] hydrolase